tara:strand:- start:597 stop:1121 length:525 start_codon:yes stop_codon:yes gene_type:complete
MSNPFTKNPTLNSGEFTKRLASISKMSTLKKDIIIQNNIHTKHITVKEQPSISGGNKPVLTQALNYETLLSYSKGYYLTTECDISSNQVQEVSDGMYSIIDLSNNSFYDASGELILDNCRTSKGLMGYLDISRNPLFVQRIFKFPKPMELDPITSTTTCNKPTINNNTPPEIIE